MRLGRGRLSENDRRNQALRKISKAVIAAHLEGATEEQIRSVVDTTMELLGPRR